MAGQGVVRGGSTAPRWPAWGWPNHPLAKRGGRPPPMGWPATLFGIFFFFFGFFFFLEKENVMGAFWE
jgi:hypothetical protein